MADDVTDRGQCRSTSRYLLSRQRLFDPGAWAFDRSFQGTSRPVRRALKAAVFRVGLGPSFRRLRQVLEPEKAKRSRAESARLRELLAFTLTRTSNASTSAVQRAKCSVRSSGSRPHGVTSRSSRFPSITVSFAIRRHRPMVVFEHEREAAAVYDTQPAHIFELLCSEAGLTIYDLDGGGPYSLDAFEREVDAGRRWNYIAHA
jgi:hypothetical protein